MTSNAWPRLDWTLEKNSCPKDPLPAKNLNGGYARQPDWSKKAVAWAAGVEHVSQRPGEPKKEETSICQDSENAITATSSRSSAENATFNEDVSVQDRTSATPTRSDTENVTLVMGRKREATDTEEVSSRVKTTSKKRRLRSALGEVNC